MNAIWSNAIALTLAAMTATSSAQTPAPLPQVDIGRIERLSDFASRHVDARHVDVWLHPACSAARRCPVIYMHDGQMLYDERTTWNKQSWDVQRAIARGVDAGTLAPAIVVGVWNNGKRRHSEYMPQKFLPHLGTEMRAEYITRALDGLPRADAYLRFLVEELKPAIDQRFPTLSAREHTHVMGSSMGGLISVYAALEYPQVFGAAAALSVHWIAIGERNEPFPSAALAYLREKLPAPGGLRLYMDRGTTELDAQYDQAQPRIDALLKERGFGEPQVVSRVFEGTGHNERAWRDRLHIPLAFLLGKP